MYGIKCFQLLQRQQQPIAVLTQQQYALAAQQQQLGKLFHGEMKMNSVTFSYV